MIHAHEESWRTVVDHASREIEKWRGQLELPGLSPADTELLRGKIVALRGVLALGKADPAEPTMAPVDYMKM